MRTITKHFAITISALLLFAVSTAQAQFFSKKTPDLLPEDQAFSVLASMQDGQLRVNWSIAKDYYMYREQFAISSSTPGIQISNIKIPTGQIENDPEFGEVEVYFYSVEIDALVVNTGSVPSNIDLVLKGQGCNKPVGVCYPPLTRVLSIAYDGANNQSSATDTNEISPSSNNKSFWAYVLAALGAGVLLSFTPCVLPMIPILAGVIAGQQNPSKIRSGWLAICYVAGTIVTYAIAGWVAGKSGTQLQAHFQNPWVIGFICALLVLLAISLFGAFKIQLPSSLQSKLSGPSKNGGSISSFGLGLISALVVGACVSPILIVTLGAAITQGDPVLGAAIMAAMATGMGLLLIAFGFGAGWLLPKTGPWMTQIQSLFGFMVLGVAIYIASGLAFIPNLYLWAGLLLCTGFYVWQLGSTISNSLWLAVIKTIAVICFIWGGMSLIGGATGGAEILRPLSTLSLSSSATTSTKSALPFNTTTTVAGAKSLLANAKAAGQPALVDFYADWCLDCKRMHRTTFTESAVADALEGWQLIEIDVTETNQDSEAVKRFFSVFGPPATLFIDAKGDELDTLRQYGYMNSEDFLSFVQQADQLR